MIEPENVSPAYPWPSADSPMESHARTLDRCFAELEAALVEEGPVGRTFGALRQIALEHDIPMAIVGGIAGNYYGLRRTTQDVDIVVRKEQLPLFGERAVAAGFVQEGPSRFSLEGGYPVDVLPSGTFPTPDSLWPTPTPAELGVSAGLDYADLSAWIGLKLLAGRPEDLGDIYRLLRPKKEAQRQELAAHLDPRAKSRYEQILADLRRRLS